MNFYESLAQLLGVSEWKRIRKIVHVIRGVIITLLGLMITLLGASGGFGLLTFLGLVFAALGLYSAVKTAKSPYEYSDGTGGREETVYESREENDDYKTRR